MKSNVIRLVACDLILLTKTSTTNLCVTSRLIQLCVGFNYLLHILYHITLYNAKFFGASLPGYYFINVTLIIHKGICTFYVAVNVYKTAGLLSFVDEVCTQLLAHLLCCLYKDYAALQMSVNT
jgi:hypothetical protein